LFPATQYAYELAPSFVITLLAASKFPLVDGSAESSPTEPAWSSVASHVHPPPGALAQVTAA
jgi:hypothetical protein